MFGSVGDMLWRNDYIGGFIHDVFHIPFTDKVYDLLERDNTIVMGNGRAYEDRSQAIPRSSPLSSLWDGPGTKSERCKAIFGSVGDLLWRNDDIGMDEKLKRN